MGLIVPKMILNKWSVTSKEHYISLGYTYTKLGDLFLCDVCDLSCGSSIKVEVECDFCHEIYQIEYRQLLKHKSDKYCCSICLTHKKKTRDNCGNLIFIEIPYRNKEWLYQEYIINNRLAEDIANECGINIRTLREWISILELNTKKVKRYSIDKEYLYDLYINQHKTTLEIGNIVNLSDGTVLHLLYEYDIPIPNRSEIMHRYYYEKGGIEKSRTYAQSIENRIKTSCRYRGIDLDEFDGFTTSESHMIRNSSEYIEWRSCVFERNNYTCQKCGKCGGDLEAHHLYPFAEFPDKRFLVDNGVTLCCKCHSPKYSNSFHSLYGVHNNTPKQYYEFLKVCDIS